MLVCVPRSAAHTEMLRNHHVHGRVIVHADLDCFYCQVEHVRLGIPTSEPLAVQQWDGIIAVNYSARKFGVKRGDRAEVAVSKCPQIKLVHVETISADSTVDGDGGAATGGEEGGVGGADATGTRVRGNCKVSLERYRSASFAIMAIFQAHCRRVERASIDEAYLDLTEEAAKLCQQVEEGKADDVGSAPDADLQGTAGHRVDPTNAFDRALLAGARLTAAMRLAVEKELGFTVSAGIASNKVLAKLASSIHKPNKQTVVPAGAALDMLDTVPLRNIRGLGGKLGEAVVSWSKAETTSDLKRFSEQDLVGRFGSKTGEWLWRACRGMDDEAVTPNLRPKSLSVCKSFSPVHDEEAVLRWMRLLCTELAKRIAVDRNTWSRRVTKLTLQIITLKPRSRAHPPGRPGGAGSNNATLMRSRTVDIPGGGEPPVAASLVSEAMTLFTKTEGALPCSRLALTAHDFNDLVSGRGSIASFMRVLPPPAELPRPQDSVPELKATLAFDSWPKARGDGAGGVGSEGKGTQSNERSEGKANVHDVGKSDRGARGSGTGGGGGSRGSNSNNNSGMGDCVNPSPPAGCDETASSSSPHGSRGETCPKCGNILAAEEDLQEHLDFHYAEGLQKRFSREGHVARDMTANMSDRGGLSKRAREGNGGRGAKSQRRGPAGRRIDSFFKPT